MVATAPPRVSVVVCTYSELRWQELAAATRAVAGQLGSGDELLIVVDHNPDLLERVRRELPGRGVHNAGARGLSGARNSGVQEAVGDVVAFLDDDALPGGDWIASWRRRFRADDVVAVGGAVDPDWEGGASPRWFPAEFGWVVGCDYVGLPGDGGRIRNPIGASMAVRRSALLNVGGFSELVGRVGTLPVGCEETELGIRLAAADPAARIIRDASSPVQHLVPRNRQRVGYFLRRCYHEGRSKRVLSGLVGARSSLDSEWRYVLSVLPTGLVRHLRAAIAGDLHGLLRAGLVLTGVAVTGVGYLSARPAATP
jgi:glycosyltransferase involved in cell wall biosynthesis